MLYCLFKILLNEKLPSSLFVCSPKITLSPGFFGQQFNNLQHAALLTSFWHCLFSNLQWAALLRHWSTAAGYGELCMWFWPIRNREIFWLDNDFISCTPLLKMICIYSQHPSLLQYLWHHKLFTVSCCNLFILFMLGIHRRVMAPQMYPLLILNKIIKCVLINK